MNGRYNTYSDRESPRDYRRPIDPDEDDGYSYEDQQHQHHPDDEPGPIGGGGCLQGGIFQKVIIVSSIIFLPPPLQGLINILVVVPV